MKKLLLGFLFFILVISDVSALKIVSLGDSISSGYLLDDQSKSFDNLFANAVGAEFYEHSYLGMRSDDLLKDLSGNKIKNEIESADIIIINTGANDLLDLLDLVDLSKVGIEIEHGTIPKVDLSIESINNLKNYLQNAIANDLEPLAIKASDDFAIVFPLIIEKIKELNPNAKIYVNNLYNPFFDVSIPILQINLKNIEEVSDNTIKMFNNTINNNSGYEIIDVYSALRNNDYLNVNPLSFAFDPHPNVYGHQKIYELYLKELCYKINYSNKTYYALKGESINIKPNKKFGYTFVKWNHDLNNINSDIELKAIYKFNFLYIVLPILAVIAILIVIKKRNSK